jgi:hypothetical protein
MANGVTPKGPSLVVVVQRVRVPVAGQRPLVHRHLAVVLAQRFQAARDLEQPAHVSVSASVYVSVSTKLGGSV